MGRWGWFIPLFWGEEAKLAAIPLTGGRLSTQSTAGSAEGLASLPATPCQARQHAPCSHLFDQPGGTPTTAMSEHKVLELTSG